MRGEEPRKGKRNDLVEIKRKLDDGAKLATIADEHFGQFLRYNRSFKEYKRIKTPARDWIPNILVFWGPTGTGKTTEAYLFDPDLYSVPVQKGSGTYFDDYDSHETILFDEFKGNLPYQFIKRMLDTRAFSLPVHGGAGHQFVARTIIFTSNFPPELWYDASKPSIGPWDRSPLKRRLDEWADVIYLGGDKTEEDYRREIDGPPLVENGEGVLFAPIFN